LLHPATFASPPVVLSKPLDYPALLELLGHTEPVSHPSLRPASSGY
jgi:hypothetical protein